MQPRILLIVPLATAWLIASPAANPNASSVGSLVMMNIESVGYSASTIEVTTTSFADEHKRPKLQPDSIVVPPLTMEIADSIQRIHVVAVGFGSVRVTLTHPGAPLDSLVSLGRDITLVRKPNEFFQRIWTVQPLLP
jgi:hypothetical protein